MEIILWILTGLLLILAAVTHSDLCGFSAIGLGIFIWLSEKDTKEEN